MGKLLTKDTTKKEWLKDYQSYPDTQPEGLEDRHDSRVLPIFYEIPVKSKVLDIGCNSGEFMVKLRDHRDCEVWGLEVSELMVEKARKKGLTVFRGTAEYLPFADNTFDVVTMMEVLVHVYDPAKVLSEVKRVLKPDGVLLGSTPHENLERYIWDDKRMHRRYYNQDTLRDDLIKEFPSIHINVLTGCQFSVGFLNSYLADKDAEILFKAGGKETNPWGEKLLDKDILRVWFMGTQKTADFYYRMGGYCDKMQKDGHETLFDGYNASDQDAHVHWQNKIKIGPDRNGDIGLKSGHMFINHLESVLRASDFTVWQVVGTVGPLMAFLSLKEKTGKKFITELDDYIFDTPSYNLASNPYRPNSDQEFIAKQQIENSDAIIVSTEFLKRQMVQMFPGKKLYVVPNSIDFDLWDNSVPLPAKPEKGKKVIRIGYTGCANHSGDMEMVKEPLLALLEEYPNLEVLIAHPQASLEDINHPRFMYFSQWADILNYPAYLKGCEIDIGLAPLRDNNFNRAKSNLRWLEYSALKVPTIASPVEPFKCIKDGEDGLIANSKVEWYEKMKSLIEDSHKRIKIGQQSYKRVKQDYNMDLWASYYKNILEEIKRS